MRRDAERLQDILEAIENIEKYAKLGKDNFEREELVQTWILHHLLVIGEAANRVSEELKARYSEVPWIGIIDVRNIVAHEYFRVNLQIIWNIVANNLPDLKRQIKQIIQEM